MKIINYFLSVLCVTLLATPPLLAQKLQVDPAHSTIMFEAKHLKVSTIPGRFQEFTGTIDYNEKDVTKSKVEFVVDVNSIYTGVEKRDDHLRSADFFDVKNHPKATFKSTKITKDDDNELNLEGNLTIRGKTKKVKFEVDQLGKTHDPTSKTDKILFSAEGEINRKDFGVNYGPNEVVSDKIELEINLETIVQSAQK